MAKIWQSGLGGNIFILWKGLKILGSPRKTRVGRVTRNTFFFFLALMWMPGPGCMMLNASCYEDTCNIRKIQNITRNDVPKIIAIHKEHHFYSTLNIDYFPRLLWNDFCCSFVSTKIVESTFVEWLWEALKGYLGNIVDPAASAKRSVQRRGVLF
jgi:hypothetical protein